MKPKFRSLIAAFAPLQKNSLIVCVSLCATAVAGADQTWTGATNASWLTATNWTSASPTLSDVAIFNSGSTANLDTFLDGEFSIAGLTVVDPGGPVSIAVELLNASVAADNATDVFTYAAAPVLPLADGAVATLGGTVPTGLTAGTQYFVVNATATTFQLSATLAGTPIDFSDDGAAVTVSDGSILKIDSAGINMSLATQPLTIGSKVGLLNDQTWTNATNLTVNGVISDGDPSNGYSLTKAGAGTLTLNGVSTYTGNTNVTGGLLYLGGNSSITSPGIITLSDGTELSIPQAIYATEGNSLQVEASATADYTVRSQGGFLADVGAVGTDATLNLNLNFNNGLVTFDRSWKFNSALWYLNIVTQPGTQSQIRLRSNGGAFDGSSFVDTDVSIDNTRIYVRSNSGGNTISIGSLTGTATSNLSGGENGSVTYSIGRATAPDTVYSGIFSDNSPTGSWTNVTKTSPNSLTIGGDCTNKGTFTIVDGTLKFGTGGSTGAPGSGAIIVDSNGFDGGQLVFDRTGAFTVAGVVSGIGPITLGGGADATFSNAASSFTGILTVNGGSITASALSNGGANSSIGAATSDAANVILNGATLGYTGPLASTDRNFTIGVNGGGFAASGSGAVTFASTAALVLDGTDTPRTLALSGTSTESNVFAPLIGDNGTGATSLSKSGAGNWDLTGANTYSGGTTVTGGTLTLSNLSGSATGPGAISVQTGASLAGNGSASGTATLESGAALIPGNNGVGTLTVGGLTLESGTTADFELQAGGPNDLVVTAVSSGLTLNGGTINLYQPGTTIPVTAAGVYNLFQYSGTLGGSIGNLTVPEPVGTDYVLGVSGGFVTVTVSAAALPNTWAFNGSGNWSAPGNWTTGVPGGAGVTVNFLGAATSPSTVTLDGSRTVGGFLFDNLNSYTIAFGSGSLTLDNSGSPANVTVATGNHAVNVNVALSSPGMVVDAAVAGSVTFGGAISGAAPIVKNGDGLLVLNGTNLFSGGVTINAGSVQIGSNGALGSGALTFAGNSSLVMGAAELSPANAVSISTGISGTINTNGNNATLGTVISGDGVLVKSGTGVLSLTNTNTYAGGTVIKGGLIQFAGVGNIGSANVTFDGGGLRWAAGNTLDPSTLTTNFLAGGGVFDTNGNNITVAGNVGGTGLGRLTKQGAGLMTLAAGQTFQGGVSVLGGTLAIDNVTAFGTVPGVATPGNLVFSDSTLQITGTQIITAVRGVTLGGAVAMTMANPADSVSIAGAITGTGSLSLQGGGIWTFNGSNSYAGGTAIGGGTVRLDGAAASLGSGTVTVANGTLLRMNRGDTTDSSSQYFTFSNELVVGSGITCTVQNTPRGNWSGPLTGSGTLNLRVNATRGDFTNPWAGFSGQINVTARQAGNEYRINLGGSNAVPTGLQLGNAKLNLADGVNMSQVANPPNAALVTTHFIGELSGTSGSFLGGQPVSGRFVNWEVGALNTNSTFAGLIRNSAGAARLTKVGAGTLTLSNANTYTGSTTVNGGSLALNATGSIANSTALVLGLAGVLDTTAKTTYGIPATQTVTFNVTGLNSGASGRINAAGAGLDITSAVVNFTIGDPLDDAVYVLANYSTLTGASFASVTAPAGYVINYAYNGGTQIALVQSAGADYTTWAAGFAPADLTNLAGDNDNDGLTNQQEYAFGLSPVSGSSVNPILVQLDKATGTFTYQRRDNALTGLTYKIWYSTNLAVWTEDTTAGQAEGTVVADVEPVTVTLTTPPTDTKFFVRVSAE